MLCHVDGKPSKKRVLAVGAPGEFGTEMCWNRRFTEWARHEVVGALASGVERRSPYWKRSTRRRSRRQAPVSRGPFNPHPSHTRVFTQQLSLIHQNGCNAGWFFSVICNRQNSGAGQGIVACGHAAVVLCSAGVPWNQPGSGASEAATKNRRRRYVAESIVRERRSSVRRLSPPSTSRGVQWPGHGLPLGCTGHVCQTLSSWPLIKVFPMTSTLCTYYRFNQ